jgi:predicted transposase/invertase (TIGR01784 family)
LKKESAELRGKEEGIAENKQETAKNMLKENFSLEQISKITHLSTSEIKKLV